MSLAASTRTPLEVVRATLAVFVTLAGVSCGLTLLYLGMRAVMDIGGACASGGPFVPRVECPEGVPLLMIGGIWGGIVFVGLYLWTTSKHRVPTLVAFAWPALFLSLGWNFLDYGVDPPVGEGLVWGWLICAVLFALMGGLPLLAMVKPVLGQFGRRAADVPPAQVVVPTRSKVRQLRAASNPGPRGSQRFGFDPKPGGPSGAPGGESLVDALERLGALHASGALSDDEFEAAKQQVLGGRG
ncbi:MAG TPA: SHOCT domain-containing protein [Actinomycetota bacterium]|nr:SHOCT domain-containing protein [Actinomycetota bacterium]